MGCYNGEGCISGLPIQYGDPIGGLICVSTKDYQGNEIITPVWPIIWGTYDDYGGIEAVLEDCSLEQYFGNRKNLLHDLERVTHGCRHQIEEGLPDNICLVVEHRSVLETLIDFVGFKTIEAEYHSGSRYCVNFQPERLFDDGGNLYRIHYCFRDNQSFLKFFREYYSEGVPADKLQSYLETIAFYESLNTNNIFLKWQRFAGWQYPSRRNDVWKKLIKVYSKLTKGDNNI